MYVTTIISENIDINSARLQSKTKIVCAIKRFHVAVIDPNQLIRFPSFDLFCYQTKPSLIYPLYIFELHNIQVQCNIYNNNLPLRVFIVVSSLEYIKYQIAL